MECRSLECLCSLLRGATVPSEMPGRGDQPVTVEGGTLSGEQIAGTSTVRLECCCTELVEVPSALLRQGEEV